MLIAESLRPEDFGHARTGAVEITDAPLPRQANEPPGDSGGSLYAPHVKIYPKRAHGRFRTAKWIVMAVTLGIYYLVPWIRWDRGPYLPDQAVLIDFPARRFYFFFLEIWPQEFYYITGLLVLAALALFLVTSVAGRVWCGYTCPQTVWTDLMIAVERFFQGDRNAAAQARQDALGGRRRFGAGVPRTSPGSLIAIATGGAWVFYFRRRADARAAARDLRGAAPRLYLHRRLHRHHLRAWRPRPRAGLHLYVPLAAHPGGDVRPRLAAHHLSRLARRAARAAQGRADAGKDAATASTASSASPSAPPASTSATARSSNASNARCASMPATRS